MGETEGAAGSTLPGWAVWVAALVVVLLAGTTLVLVADDGPSGADREAAADPADDADADRGDDGPDDPRPDADDADDASTTTAPGSSTSTPGSSTTEPAADGGPTTTQATGGPGASPTVPSPSSGGEVPPGTTPTTGSGPTTAPTAAPTTSTTAASTSSSSSTSSTTSTSTSTSSTSSTTSSTSTSTTQASTSSTTDASTTSTSDASTTSSTEASTTSTTGSTTTTSEPHGPAPGPDVAGRHTAGWRFVPDSMLLEPGESMVATLVHTDATGTPTNGAPPEELDLRTTADGVVALEPLGAGRVQVTALDEVASVMVSATVPHAELAVPLAVTVASFADGTVRLPDRNLVFPWPDRSPEAVGPDHTLPWYSPTHVGPFTWAEVRDRFDQPDVDELGVDDTPEGAAAAVAQMGNRIGIVVRGLDVAVGDLLISTGGGSAGGRVVEVITRDLAGSDEPFSLVTIEIVAPWLFFDAIHIDVDETDLQTIGVLPTPPSEPFTDADVIGPAAVLADRVTDAALRVLGALPVGDGLLWSVGNAGDEPAGADDAVVAQSAGAPVPFNAPAQDPAPDPKGIDCATHASTKAVDLKATSQFGIVPTFKTLLIDDAEYPIFQFEMGLSGHARAVLEATATLNGTVTLACKLWESPVPVTIPALPPVGMFIATEIGEEMTFEAQLQGQGGPSIAFKATCGLSIVLRAGFRYHGATDTLQDLNQFTPSWDCPRPTLELKTPPEGGLPLKVGVQAGVYLTSPIDLRAGGPVTARVARWFGNPDFGKVPIAEVKIGPRVNAVLENQQMVLQNEEASSAVGIEVAGEIGLKARPLMWLLSKLTATTSPDPSSWVIAEIDPPLSLARFYRPVNKGEVKVTVAGLLKDTTTFEVEEDHEVVVEMFTKASPGVGSLGVPTVHEVVGKMILPGLTRDLEMELEYAGDGPDGPIVRASFEATPELCDLLDVNGKTHTTVHLLPKTRYLIDPLWAWGYAGQIKLRCIDPELEWGQDRLEIPPDEDGEDFPVDLELWDVAGIERDGSWGYSIDSLPSWLAAKPDPAYGDRVLRPVLDDDGSRLGAKVVFVGDCAGLEEKVHTTVVARISPPQAGLGLIAELPVELDCRETWTKVSPKLLVEPGGPVTVTRSDGKGEVVFTIDGQTGVLADGQTSATLEVPVLGPEPTCPGVVEEMETEAGASVDGYGSDSFRKRTLRKEKSPPCQPPPPKPPCRLDCGGGGAKGDPHLTSMDGLTFDAQILGEYEYLGPDPDQPGVEAPRIHARHRLLRSLRISATVVKGVAVEHQGHVFELYAPYEARIDGEVLPGSGTYPLGDGSVAVRSGGADVHVGDVHVHIGYSAGSGSYLDFTITGVDGMPMRGLVGYLDGDPTNDLRLRDGSRTLTLAEARAHGADLYALTDSWRITDPARSIFTTVDPDFAAPNPAFSWEAIEASLPEVRAMLAELSPVCGGLDPDDPASRAMQVLAVEVSVGMAIADAAEYACSYQVHGTVGADDDGYLGRSGVSGAEVTLSAPGLTPCTTTSGSSGWYSCNLGVDLEWLRSNEMPPVPPLDVSVQARWPDSSAPIAEGTASFARLAEPEAMGRVNLDLVVDPAHLPAVRATGTLLAHGEPITAPVSMRLQPWAADGTRLAPIDTWVTPDPLTGAYALHRILPRAATSVDVIAYVGHWGTAWPTTSATVAPTGETAISFDVDHRPPRFTLQGTMTGGPTTATIWVASVSGGSVVSNRPVQVTPDPTTGEYSVLVDLVPGASAVRLRTNPGPFGSDEQERFVDGLSQGDNPPITWDVAHAPPVAVISGTMHDASGPITGSVPLAIVARRADGTGLVTITRYVTPDPVTGAYEQREVLPAATREVTVTAHVGQFVSDRVTVTATGLQSGDNPVSLVVARGERSLSVTGTATVNGAVYDGALSVQVVARDAGGATLSSDILPVTRDPETGAFSLAPRVLPDATHDVVLTAWMGAWPSADWPSQTVAVTGGTNVVVFDAAMVLREVVVSGVARWFGEPAETFAVGVSPNAGGAWRRIDVTPDPVTGAYELAFPISSATGSVDLSATVGDDPRGGNAWLYLVPDGDRTELTWDLEAVHVRLQGTYSTDGFPQGPALFPARVLHHDRWGYAAEVMAFELAVDADGRFRHDLTLASISDGPLPEGDRWELVIDTATPTRIDLGNPPRGLKVVEHDIDILPGTPVNMSGTMLRSPQTVLTVTPVVWHTDLIVPRFELLPPAPVYGLGPNPTTWQTVPFSLSTELPVEATLAVVRASTFGFPDLTEVVRITPNVPNSVTDLSLNPGERMVELSGTIDVDVFCSPNDQLDPVILQVSAFGAWDDDEGIFTVPVLHEVLVVPDEDGWFQVAFWVPQEATSVRLEVESPHASVWSGYFSFYDSFVFGEDGIPDLAEGTIPIEVEWRGYCAM